MAYASINHAQQFVLRRLELVVNSCRHVNNLEHSCSLALVLIRCELNLNVDLLLLHRQYHEPFSQYKCLTLI